MDLARIRQNSDSIMIVYYILLYMKYNPHTFLNMSLRLTKKKKFVKDFREILQFHI